MKYCTRCILPDTRPGLTLNADGICNACVSHGTKTTIDWQARRQSLEKVLARAKSLGRTYDCLVPVSGGKDSTWLVLTLLEHGMHPLCFTWKPPTRTNIGQENLENLIGQGVDHIDFTINPKVERKFVLEAFENLGTPMLPMHMAIFNLARSIAFRFDIPLIVWAENSAFEYGGADDEAMGFEMNELWLKKYGVMHGTTAKDWVGSKLSLTEMTPYFGVSDEELRAKSILSIFLGYYLPWDPEKVLQKALRQGFKTNAQGARTGYYDYADIDDDMISVHHYLKWYKFGFTRLFDNLSLEIRNRRMTREAAIEIVRKSGEQRPDSDIELFCKFVEITPKRFVEIAEKFRNLAIWKEKGDQWFIPNFLVEGFFDEGK